MLTTANHSRRLPATIINGGHHQCDRSRCPPPPPPPPRPTPPPPPPPIHPHHQANDQSEVVEPVNPLLGKFMNMSTPGEKDGAAEGSPLAGIASAMSKKPITAKVCVCVSCSVCDVVFVGRCVAVRVVVCQCRGQCRGQCHGCSGVSRSVASTAPVGEPSPCPPRPSPSPLCTRVLLDHRTTTCD